MRTLSALIQREDCPIWSTALAQLMFTTSRAECSELANSQQQHRVEDAVMIVVWFDWK